MEKSSKIWLGISGVLLVALGIMCICQPAATLFATAWTIGCFTLLSGIFKLIFTFRTQKFLPNSASRMLSAIFEIIIGIIFLCNNLFVAESLPVIFVIWIIVEGVFVAIHSFDYKAFGFPYWWALLLFGIAGVVLGVLGLRNPVASAVTLSTLIGIAILLIGAGYLIALFGINRFEKQVKEFGKAITADQQ
jgi:uncharacterized membrane protein HdeD (DUF308 family)